MSTKIYNGYILPQESYPELLLAVDAARGDIRAAAQEIIDRWISTRATELIDGRALGSKETFAHGAAMKAFSEYLDKEKRAETHREPDIDAAASFTFHLYEGRFYALIFAENRRIRDLLVNLLGAKSWAYWNNTDRPEEVTEEEWQRRADTWAAILGRDAPCDRGATFEFRAPSPSIGKERLAKLQPELHARLTQAARTIMLRDRREEYRKDMEEHNSTSSFVRVMSEIRQDLFSDTPSAAALAALTEARGLLKAELTTDDFLEAQT